MAYILLSGYPGAGKCKILKEIAADFENVVWITTTYSIENVRNGLKREAWVIDAFSWGMKGLKAGERDVVVANPTNLNEVSLSFSKVLEKISGDYLLILNSISGLAVYQPLPKILNLLRSLIVKVEKDRAKAIFTIVKGAQERGFEISLMMFFPNIAEIEEGKLKVLKTSYSEFEKRVYGIEEAKQILTKMLF
jgi:predicted ATP-dependent serine protease